MQPICFETHPDSYKHWQLRIEPPVAWLIMDVQENEPLAPGYALKLNSYDLGVDIELADAVQRLRFEHPAVKVVVLTSAKDRVFSAGANIHMLGSSSHAFKVNFCKYTNETRLAIEDAALNSGLGFIAACNGVTAGGGYELALACDQILLVDDGSSAVSLPEVPLLGVLPGTGGLTRLVDKRRVRRDRADVFCTLGEGIRGKRAVEWRLVDAVLPKSRFEAEVAQRAAALATQKPLRSGPGVQLTPLERKQTANGIQYSSVTLQLDADKRQARLTVHAPAEPPPRNATELRARGAQVWPLQVFRELDDAFCNLRFNAPSCGLVLLDTRGDADAVLAWDSALFELREDWFVREVLLFVARTLRRVDLTARSIFALAEPGSCFSGTLLELGLAADRTYALDAPERPVRFAVGPLNGGFYPMTHGMSRLETRWMSAPERVAEILAAGPYDPQEAERAGLVTVVADEIDYEDELRVAIEERSSLSPDALTGMEASLRYPGNENMNSKIFGRLSAWQNWVFQRPNAVGERGALKLYGQPERPSFDWGRT